MTPPKKPASSPTADNAQTESGAVWKKRGEPHRITLPSGQHVRARVGLSTFWQIGEFPEDLRDAVLIDIAFRDQGGLPAAIAAETAANGGDAKAKERVDQRVDEFRRITLHRVAAALVEPDLTVDELAQVPEEDLEFLMEVVTRRRPFDAAGFRIGIEPVDAWATFCHEHECADDCEACARALAALSTLHLDPV